jgi:integrase
MLTAGRDDDPCGLSARLRVPELTDLRWELVDFRNAALHVRRAKQGTPSTHPILGDELRSRRRQCEQEPRSPLVFTSESGAPSALLASREWSSERGLRRGLKIHPHTLRRACGYALANKGDDTRALLGHRNIQNTSAVHRAIADPVQANLATLEAQIKYILISDVHPSRT